jgi:hypothetical protein
MADRCALRRAAPPDALNFPEGSEVAGKVALRAVERREQACQGRGAQSPIVPRPEHSFAQAAVADRNLVGDRVERFQLPVREDRHELGAVLAYQVDEAMVGHRGGAGAAGRGQLSSNAPLPPPVCSHGHPDDSKPLAEEKEQCRGSQRPPKIHAGRQCAMEGRGRQPPGLRLKRGEARFLKRGEARFLDLGKIPSAPLASQSRGLPPTARPSGVSSGVSSGLSPDVSGKFPPLRPVLSQGAPAFSRLPRKRSWLW